MSRKDEKIEAVIQQAAGDFFTRSLDVLALVTVAEVKLQKHGTEALIYLSVLPENFSEAVYKEARRKRPELWDYLNDKTNIGKVPKVDIALTSLSKVVEEEVSEGELEN